ncbi:MAG: DUF4105 domain-containing protein [Bacteroidales bacterium]
MLHRLCLLLVLLLSVEYLSATEQSMGTLQGSELTVSILTYEPGDEVYSLFGHTAIRVQNSSTKTDIVYNYGTFDFDTPNFVLKFVRGNLKYQLARGNFQRVLYGMFQENRTVYEQRLHFTPKEKSQLVEALEKNYQPENRYYLYDFFHDNCATRVHEMLHKHIDSTVVFDSGKYRVHTFRSLLDKYTAHRYWLANGINILLGKRADEQMKPVEYMFIPDYVMYIYSEMQVKRGDAYEPLTSDPITLYKAPEGRTQQSFPWHPIVFALSVFVFIWSIWEYVRMPHIGRIIRFLDFSLFLLLGLLGITIVALWVGSKHTAFDANWNVLWANPLFLLVAMGCFKRTWSMGMRGLIIVLMLLLILLVLVGGVLIGQSFPQLLLPLVIVLLGRLLVLLKRK